MEREREAALALVALIFFSMFYYPSVTEAGKMEALRSPLPAPAQNPGKPDIAVTFLSYTYINSTHMMVNASIENFGSESKHGRI